MANSGINACREPDCENYAVAGAWTWWQPGSKRLQIGLYCEKHGNRKKATHILYRPGFMGKKEVAMPGNHFIIEYGDWNEDGTRYLTNKSGFSIVIIHNDGTREIVKNKACAAVRKSTTIEALEPPKESVNANR